jgi:hypothetical protein
MCQCEDCVPEIEQPAPPECESEACDTIYQATCVLVAGDFSCLGIETNPTPLSVIMAAILATICNS